MNGAHTFLAGLDQEQIEPFLSGEMKNQDEVERLLRELAKEQGVEESFEVVTIQAPLDGPETIVYKFSDGSVIDPYTAQIHDNEYDARMQLVRDTLDETVRHPQPKPGMGM